MPSGGEAEEGPGERTEIRATEFDGDDFDLLVGDCNDDPGNFIYDPTSGDNLLMDITVTDKPGGWAFYRGDGQGVTSRAVSGFADGNGLRTLIEFQTAQVSPVPEPSSLILLGTGIAAVITGRGWRRKAGGSTSVDSNAK